MPKSLVFFLIFLSTFQTALAASTPEEKPAYSFFPEPFQGRMNALVEEIKERTAKEEYQETELDRAILLLWSFNEPHGCLKSNSHEASYQRRAYYRQFLETIPCSFLSKHEQERLFFLFLKLKSIDEIRTLSPEISIPYKMRDAEIDDLFSYLVLKSQGVMRNIAKGTRNLPKGLHQIGAIEEEHRVMRQFFEQALKEDNWLEKLEDKCSEVAPDYDAIPGPEAYQPPSQEKSFYLAAGEWLAYIRFLDEGKGSPDTEDLREQIQTSFRNDLPQFANSLALGPRSHQKSLGKITNSLARSIQNGFSSAFKKAENGLKPSNSQYNALRLFTAEVFADSPRESREEVIFTAEEIEAFNQDLRNTQSSKKKKKKKKKNVAKFSSQKKVLGEGPSKSEESVAPVTPPEEGLSQEERQARKCFGRAFPGKLHYHVHRWFTESKEEDRTVNLETVRTWADYEHHSNEELQIKIYKHTLGALLPKLLNQRNVLKRYATEYEESSVRKNFTLAASIFRVSISGHREKICDGVYKIAYDEVEEPSGDSKKVFYHNYLHDKTYAEEIYQAQRRQPQLAKKKKGKRKKEKKKKTRVFSWMPLLQLQPEAVKREEGWVDILPGKTPIFFDYDSSSHALIFTLKEGLDDIVMAVLPRP